MNLRLPVVAISVVAFVMPAFAEDEPSNADLLKAIQNLSSQIETLQADVHLLKEKDATPVPKSSSGRSTPTPTPVAPATAPKGKSIPGWLVNVVPGDDTTRDAVATFGGPTSNFDFSLHTKYLSGENEFAYRGSAFFHPSEPGRYVFVLELDPVLADRNGTWSGEFNCEANFRISDKTVVEGQTMYNGWAFNLNLNKKNEFFRPQSFSGGANLEDVDYKASFTANCYIRGRDKGEILQNAFTFWQDNKFSILVKGPDDEKARPFDGSELFHVGKAKKS